MSPVDDGLLTLPDLLQITATNRRTVRLRVRAGEATGALYVESGALVHAELGPLIGNDAVYAALGARAVAVSADPGVTTARRTVDGSTPQLLLEAARRLDEGSVPVVSARPSLFTLSAARPPRRRGVAALAGAIAIVVAASITLILVPRGGGGGGGASAAPGAAEAVELEAEAVDGATLTGPGDVQPTLVAGAAPARPAVDLALTPTVVCRVLVGADGSVQQASVYRSRLELAAFEAAALDAIAGWRFTPPKRAGAPVAAWVNWPVTFAGDHAAARVRIKGSDTIGGALGPALGAAFSVRRPDVEVTVEALGSSTAFVGLLDGSAEIGASSRPVKPAELADAERLGAQLVEHVLGYDGLAIVVHPDNPLTGLTMEQASRIFRGEVTRWSELGGPDRAIRLFTRPAYSGTYDFFVEHVVKLGDKGAAATMSTSARAVEHSDALVAAVAGDPDAIGFAGLGWVDGAVRALAIAPGEDQPAIRPSAATVRDGSYPIYRPLLLYTRGAPRGATAELVRFALSDAGQALVEQHGFVPGDTPAAIVDAIGAADGTAERGGGGTLAARLAFGAGSATPSRALRPALIELVARAKDDARVTFLIVGHADAEGGSDSAGNARLALRRARAIARWLEQSGVDPGRLVVESAGAAQPVGTNTTAGGRDQNRRVDVFVVPAAGR